MILFGQHLLLLSIESSPSADTTSTTTATNATAKSMLYTESAEEVRLPRGLTVPTFLPFRSTPVSQMHANKAAFIQQKRMRIDESNAKEFLEDRPEGGAGM